MRYLNIILVVAILFLQHLHPNGAGRILHEKGALVRRMELKLQSLQRATVPPSGPSGCTFIPGTNGPGCPLNEKHYAANGLQQRRSTYPRLVAPVRVVEARI